MARLNTVILAAGKGERMVSSKPKVLHEIMGRPMVSYVVEAAKRVDAQRVVVVLGHGREEVASYLKGSGVEIAVQAEQKGTAHAVLTAEASCSGGDLLVLYGDVPLIEEATLDAFLSFARETPAVTFLTTTVENPAGYGRVIRKGEFIEGIVEDGEATAEQKAIREINSGICFIPGPFFPLIRKIKAENRKGEYYLTDICTVAAAEDIPVRAFHHGNATEVLGINTRKELLDAHTTMRNRILDRHMRQGVTILDRNVSIDEEVVIGKDTTISPGCFIMGRTIIGEGAFIGPATMVKSCRIGDRARIEGFTVMEGVEVAADGTVGPLSRLMDQGC